MGEGNLLRAPPLPALSSTGVEEREDFQRAIVRMFQISPGGHKLWPISVL